MTDQNKAAPAPSSLAGGSLIQKALDAISDIMTEAIVEEPAGRGAGYRVCYDEPAIRAILSALSPEAPARVGVPRDEQGRTAFEIIADCNRESMMRRAGVKDQSREPLLGPPSDMAVSRILLAERPEIDRHAADLLAIKINDTLAALTPRHEAQASEDEARRKLINCIDQWDSEMGYDAEDRASLADDILHAFNGPPVVSHEAPAEGAGEAPRAAINSLTRSVENFDNGYEWGCDPVAVRAILRHLRARSSAPEALGNLLAVIHRDGGQRTLVVGVEQAALEAEKIVANLLSSATEAREGEAVERKADGLAHLVAAISLLKRAEEIGKKPSMATGSKKMFDQMVKDYEGAADRMRKAIYTHPAAPSADKLRIAVEAIWEIAGGRAAEGHNEAGRLERIKDRAAEILAALKGDAK